MSRLPSGKVRRASGTAGQTSVEWSRQAKLPVSLVDVFGMPGFPKFPWKQLCEELLLAQVSPFPRRKG